MKKNRKETFQFLMRDWDTKIMSYVMLVVVAIAGTSATVAWFILGQTARASQINMTAAESKTIRVAVTSKEDTSVPQDVRGVDVDELRARGKNVTADFVMPVFENVEEQSGKRKLAPGVYGEVTLYITSLDPSITRYRLVPSLVLTFAGEISSEDSPEGDKTEMLEQLAEGHFLLYTDRKAVTDAHGQESYVYSGRVTAEYPVEGYFTWNDRTAEEIAADGGFPVGDSDERAVTLYWVWPYEYTDLVECTTSVVRGWADDKGDAPESAYPAAEILEPAQVFDPGCMQKNQEAQNEGKDPVFGAVQMYDYGDTAIGSFITSMKLHLEVTGGNSTEEGNHGQGAGTQ